MRGLERREHVENIWIVYRGMYSTELMNNASEKQRKQGTRRCQVNNASKADTLGVFFYISPLSLCVMICTRTLTATEMQIS